MIKCILHCKKRKGHVFYTNLTVDFSLIFILLIKNRKTMSQKLKKNKTRKYSDLNKNAIWIMVIGLILVIILPSMITKISLPWSFTDFSDTGVIGDTIGGITSPIVGFVGAALVFLSFKAQLDANRIQFKSIKKNQKKQSIDDAERFLNELLIRLKTFEEQRREQIDFLLNQLLISKNDMDEFNQVLKVNKSAVESFKHFVIMCAYFQNRLYSDNINKATRDIFHIEFFQIIDRIESPAFKILTNKEILDIKNLNTELSNFMMAIGSFTLIHGLVGKYCDDLQPHHPLVYEK